MSQVSFAYRGVFAGDVCMLGDAAAMIAPLCGDGMAMALRSSELAVPAADGFLEGALSPEAFRRRLSWQWRREFGVRLLLGGVLHRAVGVPALGHLGLLLCERTPRLGRWFIRATRG